MRTLALIALVIGVFLLANKEAVGLSASVHYRGNADAHSPSVTFIAGRDPGERTDGTGGVLAAHAVPPDLPVGAAVLLAIGAIMAATIASQLWRQTKSPMVSPDEVAGDG